MGRDGRWWCYRVIVYAIVSALGVVEMMNDIDCVSVPMYVRIFGGLMKVR